jgi:hypothetical protein
MLLNPTATLAITPCERNGVTYSQVAIQGYTYTVAETIDEIDALISGRVTIDHVPALAPAVTSDGDAT